MQRRYIVVAQVRKVAYSSVSKALLCKICRRHFSANAPNWRMSARCIRTIIPYTVFGYAYEQRRFASLLCRLQRVCNCFVFMTYSTARFILLNVPVVTLKYLSLNKLVSIPSSSLRRRKRTYEIRKRNNNYSRIRVTFPFQNISKRCTYRVHRIYLVYL
jgi:hypothetical protein